jgi:hypothetical protein
MTDINDAFGSFSGGSFEDDFTNTPQQPSQQQRPQQQPPPQKQMDVNEYHKEREKESDRRKEMEVQREQVRAVERPQIQQSFQNKTPEHFNNYRYQRNPEYSFWDRMVMSKREVLKLFILSIVVILGISLEKIGYHYISLYLNSTDLSTFQEFLVRISFPLIVFLLLWIIKSL